MQLLVSSLNQQSEQLNQQSEKLNEISRQVVSVKERVEYVTEDFYTNLNPWEVMSNTTDGTANDVRGKFIRNYSLRSPLKCMLSGLFIPDNQIKLAHILPRSTKAKVYRKLGMRKDDINGIRNLLLLSKNVEEAFDSMRISFVPRVNEALCREYVMHVWDDSVCEEAIHDGASTNIGDYLKVPLTLRMNETQIHEPFRRCLSYHAFMCFWKWSKEGKTGLTEPFDFDNSVYETNAENKVERAKYFEQFIRDRREEASDSDSD
jgi:hypothetical protein